MSGAGGTSLTMYEAARAAADACRAVGLNGADAELIRLSHNALYRVADPPLVIRVARGSDEWARAEREVCVARWLNEVGVSAARLWGDHQQPVEALERPVTFWEALSPSNDETSAADLGSLLAVLHRIERPSPCDLPEFDPLRLAEAQARSATNVPQALTAVMLERCELLRTAVGSLEFVLSAGAIHGDAYRGNVLRRDGRPVLIDFERFTNGPREWDLVPMAIAHRRFGLPDRDWAAFLDAYGFDVETWPGFDVLGGMREVMATCWLMQLVDDHPDVLLEVETRVESIKDGDHGRPWRAF